MSNEKKNIIWNFLGLSINSFNSMLFLIIINRINGPADGGIFTYAFSLISLLYFIGLYFNRPYQIANENKKNIKDFIVTRCITTIIMFLVSIILTIILNYNLYKSLVIILICIFRSLESISDVLYGIEQKRGMLYLSGYSLFAKGILGLLCFLLVDIFTKNILLSICSLIIVNLVIILLFDIKKNRGYIKGKYNYKNIINILKSTFPIFVFSFLNVYLVNSSKYTLDFICSAEIQNIYGIILMPGTILSLCSQYILNPYLLNLNDYISSKKYYIFEKNIKKIMLSIFFIGFLCILACYTLGVPVLNYIYNIDLIDYRLHLIIIMIGAIFMALIAILSSVLTIFNKNKIQMIFYIINSIISIVLSIVLIKKLFVFGASLNYTLIMFIQFICYYITYKSCIKKFKKEKN